MSREDKPSSQVALQRIRNRLIEYLELASSFERQRAYQALADVSVPNEVINQWEDWVTEENLATFTPPVFSPNELAAIAAFDVLWKEVAAGTPDPLPSLERTLELPAWERLRKAAEVVLRVLAVRGRLREDVEL